MARLEWDKTGERFFETGVRMGVLFKQDSSGSYGEGVAWNGLTAVNEKPTGAENTELYANDEIYLNLTSNEKFEATIEAYTYPDEFAECDGSAAIAAGVYADQQTRKSFGMTYRNAIGNDVVGAEFAYKLHFVYGMKAAPSEKNKQTINDSPEAVSLSWEISTTPVDVPGFKRAAHLWIDSRKADPDKLAALEKIIYGDEDTEPRLPMPAEIITIMGQAVSSE